MYLNKEPNSIQFENLKESENSFDFNNKIKKNKKSVKKTIKNMNIPSWNLIDTQKEFKINDFKPPSNVSIINEEKIKILMK